MRKLIAAIAGMMLSSMVAFSHCLTPSESVAVVPAYEQSAFDDIQDLRGPLFTQFIRYLSGSGIDPRAGDEVMVFYAKQKGHGADVRLVWFENGCAVSKDSMPAEIWLFFMAQGKDL